MPETVTATDDGLQIYRDRDLGSLFARTIQKGDAIQLGARNIHEGREWIEATLSDGTVGFILGPAARGHTTMAEARSAAKYLPSRPPQPPPSKQDVQPKPCSCIDGRCSFCSGASKCRNCSGKGTLAGPAPWMIGPLCERCFGTGKCVMCEGTGVCILCHGSGHDPKSLPEQLRESVEKSTPGASGKKKKH